MQFNDYAQEVTDYYKQHGFMVDVDVDDARNMKKKIATACSEDYTYLMIVGKKEMEDKTVAMRCGLEQGKLAASVCTRSAELQQPLSQVLI